MGLESNWSDKTAALKRMIVGAVVIFVILFVIGPVIFRFKMIEPGYTGIKINKLGAGRGVSKENLITGLVFYSPIITRVVAYPTFVQRVAWTHDVHEGNAVNEELTFNTKDSVPVNVDAAVSYILAASKVPEFYTEFRADDIRQFTHGFMRDTTRNIISQVGSEYTFDEINGPKKEEFLARVGKQINESVSKYGISIQQFGAIGALRPPQALLEAVNAKTQAIQNSIRVENELRQATAEAKKRVAIAEGEAAANRALASSIDPRLIQWEQMKLQRAAIDKWNGKMPDVMGGGNSGMLFNIPASGK